MRKKKLSQNKIDINMKDVHKKGFVLHPVQKQIERFRRQKHYYLIMPEGGNNY